MVRIRFCASEGMMPRLTDPPPMITERGSWTYTEADEPETRLEKPGTPTTDRSGLPVGLGSSGNMPTSMEASSIGRQRHAPSSTTLVRYLNPIRMPPADRRRRIAMDANPIIIVAHPAFQGAVPKCMSGGL